MALDQFHTNLNSENSFDAVLGIKFGWAEISLLCLQRGNWLCYRHKYIYIYI
jgi:hypothetical protein